MRRLTSVLGSLCLMIWLSLSVNATEGMTFSAVKDPTVPTASRIDLVPLTTTSLKAIKESPQKATPSVVLIDKSMKSVKKSTKSITSITDLSGSYVQTYLSLTSTIGDGGTNVIIEPIEGTDSIKITNFWDIGTVVKAKVDIATKKITIPNQIVGKNATYGDFDIAFCTPTGAPDRKTEIEGTILSDGSLQITSWWGMYIKSGSSADSFFGVFYDTNIERTNATMEYQLFSGKAGSYGVIFQQESANVVKVKNFGNYGKTVEIILNRNLTGTIASQIGRAGGSTNGDWLTYSTTYSAEGALTSYAAQITLNAATDKRTLSWGNWTLLNLTAKTYLGALVSGTIKTNEDIIYPELSVTEFEGEGTEASPYLIKKLDDLVLLSDNVNNETELPYTNGISNYARVYMNKFFRLENDIDMSGYRFTPIGKDWSHHFAGTFDGNGKKLIGLDVSTGSAGMAGLFGKCDTISVIKNLTLTSPDVKSASYYSGGVAAWSLGTIDNCHVTGGSVYNEGQCAGAIAGISTKVSNCTVKGCQIVSYLGFGGGVAGEVDKYITDSYAIETTIIVGGASSSSPSGGIVGSLYKAIAKNCYFSGSLDGSKLTSDLYLGGVAGVAYMSSIEKCFNTALIKGTGTKTAVGGVAGCLYGSIKDSYNVGRIISIGSRRAGGITGLVNAYALNDAIVQSEIKNSYTAGAVEAETYQYNPEVEVRETLGTITDGTTPAIENIYFDKQMVNLTSVKYGTMTSDLTKAAGPAGFSNEAWVFTDGFYPRIKGIEDTETSKFSASAIIMDANSNSNKVSSAATLNALGNTVFGLHKNGSLYTTGYYSTIEGNQLKLSENFGSDTLFIANGKASRYLILKVAPIPFEGMGTQDNPFLIKTKDDLITLSKVTTKVKQYFPDTYFKMTNDIDLQYSPDFLGICTDAADAHNQFAGHFDGGGFTIHNMYLNSVVWKLDPKDSPDGMGNPDLDLSTGVKGFIGRLGVAGSLKNLTIAADAKLTFFAQSAALVGYCYGLIDNCKNYADVIAYSCWVGGIAGQTTAESVIKNCYNSGNITTGYMQAGGISGTAYGVIENCMNTGDVSAIMASKFSTATKLNNVGGISGNATGASFTNVVNTGKVTGNSKVGGIAGTLAKVSGSSYVRFNDVIGAVNYGTIYSNDKSLIGGIGGDKGTEGTISGVYWDAQIIPIPANGNADCAGMNGVETSVLTSGNVLENLSADVWSFEKGSYPVLKQFANEEKAIRSRKVVLNIPTGTTAKDVSKDATITAVDGCSWKLAQGNVFKLEGNVLKAPISVDAVKTDTLVATYGDYVKSIVISRLPGVPLTGKGTKEDPYLIKTTTEWNNLASFMTATANTFEGSYLKVENDINFKDVAFSILAGDGVTYLQGTLEGNNKTISGISFAPTASYQGAIGIVGDKAIVRNLTLAGDVVDAGYTYSAGFVGKAYGTFENCVNKINVSSTKSSIGGFAGMIYAGAKLTDCVNEGTVTSSSTNVAGLSSTAEGGVSFVRCGNKGKISYTGTGASSYLAGLLANSNASSFIDCYNTGEIEVGTQTKSGIIAGLIANVKSTATSDPYIFKGCYNTASITGNALLGGLVATVDANSAINAENCYNTGDIVAVSTSAVTSSPTAGLFALYAPGSSYTGCWNSGTIMSQKNVYTGGILGYYKSAPTADKPLTITKCYNTGDIVASGNQGGGIIGYCNNYITLDGCYNEGSIQGGFGLGGIAGCFTGANSVMKNCWNAGTISTSTYRAGGLIGYNASNATVTNCYNVGVVETTNTVKGTTTTSGYAIGGLAGQGGAVFTNCYNTGTVTGASQVGGLIGYPYKGTTKLVSCYNAGKIVADADTCGSLIGVNLANGRMWNDANSVSDSYYVTDFGIYANSTVGTAKTLKELGDMDLGEGWEKGDKYTLPILVDFVNEPSATVNAAILVFADGDNLESVTKDFFVGTPNGTSWKSSISNISVVGNNAKFTNDMYVGQAKMTASNGKYSKVFELTVNKPSGVSDTTIAKEIVSETYYTISGIKVSKPENKDGSVYVVVKIYDDGTKNVEKVID